MRIFLFLSLFFFLNTTLAFAHKTTDCSDVHGTLRSHHHEKKTTWFKNGAKVDNYDVTSAAPKSGTLLRGSRRNGYFRGTGSLVMDKNWARPMIPMLCKTVDITDETISIPDINPDQHEEIKIGAEISCSSATGDVRKIPATTRWLYNGIAIDDDVKIIHNRKYQQKFEDNSFVIDAYLEIRKNDLIEKTPEQMLICQ